jgi:hypothetical protein
MGPKRKDTPKKKPPRAELVAKLQRARDEKWYEIQDKAGLPRTTPPWYVPPAATKAKPKAESQKRDTARAPPSPTTPKKPPKSAPNLRREASATDACQERLQTAERRVKTLEEKLVACTGKVEELAQKSAALAAERRDTGNAPDLERLRAENRACQERLERELGRLAKLTEKRERRAAGDARTTELTARLRRSDALLKPQGPTAEQEAAADAEDVRLAAANRKRLQEILPPFCLRRGRG